MSSPTWVELWSEKHQRPYFVNKKTKETKWKGVESVFQRYDRVAMCRKRRFPNDWNHTLEMNRFIVGRLAREAVEVLLGKFALEYHGCCATLHTAHPSAPSLRVLDVGCGKGSDLRKWLFDDPKQIGVVHGIDGSPKSIQKANANLKHWKGTMGFPQTADVQYKVHDLRKKKPWASLFDNEPYDVISAQFVLPYFFSTQALATAFFTRAAEACRAGGVLIAVYPSEKELAERFFAFDRAQRMREIGTHTAVPLPEWYGLSLIGAPKKKVPAVRPPTPYHLCIEGTVDSPEYTVPEAALREVLHKTGWSVVKLQGVQGYRYQNIGWQVNSDASYAVNTLYNVLICKKKTN